MDGEHDTHESVSSCDCEVSRYISSSNGGVQIDLRCQRMVSSENPCLLDLHLCQQDVSFSRSSTNTPVVLCLDAKVENRDATLLLHGNEPLRGTSSYNHKNKNNTESLLYFTINVLCPPKSTKNMFVVFALN